MTRAWECGFLVVSLLAPGCVADGPAEISHALSIMNGADENGAPATVKLIGDAGGFGTILCSGTVIADSVVVTAKHCVSGTLPGDWVIQTGGVGGGGGFTVREFRMTAGAGIDNEDIAALILNESTGIAPMSYLRALPFGFVGDDVTLIGYGETETGSSGRKKTTTDAVNYIDAAWFLTDSVDNGACHGDSGGTAMEVATGALAGVIVFVTDDACGNGETGNTRTDQFLDILDGALDDAGAGCVATGADLCGDGLDQDCVGGADSGCLPMGAPCVTDDSCQTGECLTSEGTCTQACDWLRPSTSCPDGAHCEVTEYPTLCADGICSCSPPPGAEGVSETGFGHCELGAPGTGAVGDACAGATDCANGSCLPDDGGVLRCLDPCTAAGVGCEAGEVCVMRPGFDCGACVPGDGSGFGSPCAQDSECVSGRCVSDGTGSFCSDACGAGCPDGYECGPGDVCVHEGRLGQLGDPCEVTADCDESSCYTAEDGSSFCTDACDETSPCPEGFRCEDVCLPDKALLGQDCMENEECLSELCAFFAPEQWGGPGYANVCSRYCSDLAPCPEPYLCTEFGTSTLCMPPPPVPEPKKSTYGCGCRTSPDASGFAAGALFVALATAVRRRRGS